MLLNCGIASFLSALATFTATIVALNWTQFNVSVLTETDARHFYFAANGQTAPNGKSQCNHHDFASKLFHGVLASGSLLESGGGRGLPRAMPHLP